MYIYTKNIAGNHMFSFKIGDKINKEIKQAI